MTPDDIAILAILSVLVVVSGICCYCSIFVVTADDVSDEIETYWSLIQRAVAIAEGQPFNQSPKPWPMLVVHEGETALLCWPDGAQCRFPLDLLLMTPERFEIWKSDERLRVESGTGYKPGHLQYVGRIEDTFGATPPESATGKLWTPQA